MGPYDRTHNRTPLRPMPPLLEPGLGGALLQGSERLDRGQDRSGDLPDRPQDLRLHGVLHHPV